MSATPGLQARPGAGDLRSPQKKIAIPQGRTKEADEKLQ
jgi:hypothetical protein